MNSQLGDEKVSKSAVDRITESIKAHKLIKVPPFKEVATKVHNKEHYKANQVLFSLFYSIQFFVPNFEKKELHDPGATGIYTATTMGKGNEVPFTYRRNIPSPATLL